MKTLALLMLAFILPLAAKPGKPKAVDPVPVVRLLYASGKEYGCAVPVTGDKLLTVSHANAFAGQVVRCTYKGITVERKVAASVRVIVPRITQGTGAENRGGDLAVLTLDDPLPYWIPRQKLDPKLMHGSPVKFTHQDGKQSLRYSYVMGYREAAVKNPAQPPYPDLGNPRWMLFSPPAKAWPVIPGDSGGGIYRGKYLTSIISRSSAGPALAHKDVQAALKPQL